MILQAKVLIVIDRDGFNLMGINQMENPFLANQQLLQESKVETILEQRQVCVLITQRNLNFSREIQIFTNFAG